MTWVLRGQNEITEGGEKDRKKRRSEKAEPIREGKIR